MKDFFKRVLTRTCAYFTLIVSIFSLVLLFMYSSGDTALALEPLRVVLFIPFCICFALANVLFKTESISVATKWFLHALLTICGAFFFLLLPANMTGSQNLVGFVLIAFAYLIFVVFFALFKKRLKTSAEQDRILREKSKQYKREKRK